MKSVPGYHQVLSDEKMILGIEDLSLDDIVPRKKLIEVILISYQEKF